MPNKGRSARVKGKTGEREVCKLIKDNLGITVERNLNQTREGGGDITGLPGVCIEVKRREVLAIPQWWRQTKKAANGETEKRGAYIVPVLFYRQNNKDWEVITEAGFFNPGIAGKWFTRDPVKIETDSFLRVYGELWQYKWR